MNEKFHVMTASELSVFEGSYDECLEYIYQALKKGSVPGYLRVVDEKTFSQMNAKEKAESNGGRAGHAHYG